MIIIQGTVGAGKSTLSQLIADHLGYSLYPESVQSNPYLAKYYQEPDRYVFPMQMFLLHNRFKITMEAQANELCGKSSCILDTSIYTNDIFAEIQHAMGIMTSDDYLNYCTVSATFKNVVKSPELLIYLKCDIETALKRVIKRGRPSELKAPLNYWIELLSANDSFYEEYSSSNKLVIDVTHLDIVNNPGHKKIVFQEIQENL